jgi:putative transcriptional regulator
MIPTIQPDEDGYLQGRLLVATPNIVGSHFQHSVILMCAHSAEGAMGIIINHTLDNIFYSDLFEQLGLPTTALTVNPTVHYGGPVEVNRGFVIYEHDERYLKEAMLVVGNVAISGSLGVLKAISEDSGPKRCLLALGYAGWGPKQLEAEIEENSWISVPLNSDLIFDQSQEEKWERAAQLQGIDLRKFSTMAGHA